MTSHVNSSKTKVMTNCEDKISIIIEGSTEPLEQVNTFQYLGASIVAEVDCRADIKKRLAIASSTLANLKILFKSGAISNNLKWRLVKALVWPVAAYGCESWTLRKADEEKINSFENTCFSKGIGHLVDGQNN